MLKINNIFHSNGECNISPYICKGLNDEVIKRIIGYFVEGKIL
jgi:hypothetical protein